MLKPKLTPINSGLSLKNPLARGVIGKGGA